MKRGLITALVLATTACARPGRDQLQDVLSRVHVRYSTDAHGNTDLLEHPEIQSLVAARSERMVRDLIGLLTSTAETCALKDGKRGVPLGYVSFDLLCSILEPTAWMDSEGFDCGIWAAVREPFQVTTEEVGVDPVRALAAQSRWLDLLSSGELRLTDPLKTDR